MQSVFAVRLKLRIHLRCDVTREALELLHSMVVYVLQYMYRTVRTGTYVNTNMTFRLRAYISCTVRSTSKVHTKHPFKYKRKLWMSAVEMGHGTQYGRLCTVMAWVYVPYMVYGTRYVIVPF